MTILDTLRGKPHWSFSSISTYLSCQLKWAFRYHFKLTPEKNSIPLLLGSSFHAAAEELAIARQHGDYSCVTEVRQAFSHYWNVECQAADKLAFSNNDEFDQLDRLGQDMMECLYFNWNEGDIIGVAKAFSVDLPEVSKPLIGEYDLLVRDGDGKAVVVDWKTSSRKYPKGKVDKDLQATAYAYSWYQNHGVIPEVRFDVITKAKTPTYEQHSTHRIEEDFQRLIKLVQTVERATEAEIFVPNEQSFFCASCQYKNACKEWGCALSKAA